MPFPQDHEPRCYIFEYDATGVASLIDVDTGERFALVHGGLLVVSAYVLPGFAPTQKE